MVILYVMDIRQTCITNFITLISVHYFLRYNFLKIEILGTDFAARVLVSKTGLKREYLR